jgi:hypothetical protein
MNKKFREKSNHPEYSREHRQKISFRWNRPKKLSISETPHVKEQDVGRMFSHNEVPALDDCLSGKKIMIPENRSGEE